MSFGSLADVPQEYSVTTTPPPDPPGPKDDKKIVPSCDGDIDNPEMSCMLFQAIDRAPAICTTNPQASECIVNYAAAFCADLVESRKAANNPILAKYIPDYIEYCIRSVSLGPCVANPWGLACQSNMFAGIKYPVPPGGSAFNKRNSLEDWAKEDHSPEAEHAKMIKEFRQLLPEEQAKVRASQHIFEEFFIGVGKWVFNEVAATWAFFHRVRKFTHASWCTGMGFVLASKDMLKWCKGMWTDAQVSKAPEPVQLEYNNKIQQSGGIAALVISTLLAINDIVKAARFIGPQAWRQLYRLFKGPTAIEVTRAGKTVKGFKIEGWGVNYKGGKVTAVENSGNGKVEMFDLVDGEAVPYKTAEDAENALDETMNNAFSGCIESSSRIGKRDVELEARMPLPNCVAQFLPGCLKRIDSLQIACPPVSSGDRLPSPYVPGPSTEASSSRPPGSPLMPGTPLTPGTPQRLPRPFASPIVTDPDEIAWANTPKGPPLPGTAYYNPEFQPMPPGSRAEPRAYKLPPRTVPGEPGEPDKIPYKLPKLPKMPADLTVAITNNPKVYQPELVKMHTAFVKYALPNHAVETPPTWGTELQPWADRVEANLISGIRKDKRKLRQDYANAYHLTPLEVDWARWWSAMYTKGDRFRTGQAMGKLPSYRGLCYRTTTMKVDTIEMLMGSLPGRRGVPGIYDVSDLLENSQTFDILAQGDITDVIMQTSPGLAGDAGFLGNEVPQPPRSMDHYFVIRSKHGKYIAPLEGYHQIDFVDTSQGRFKLLGYGGGGYKDSPRVFYFDNIDNPPRS